jgi:hypothetical protein
VRLPGVWSQTSSRGIILRSVLTMLAVVILLAGLASALLIKTSEGIRPDCIAGVREQDCGTFTNYHMGVRWLIVAFTVALVCGLLLARRTIKTPADSS